MSCVLSVNTCDLCLWMQTGIFWKPPPYWYITDPVLGLNVTDPVFASVPAISGSLDLIDQWVLSGSCFSGFCWKPWLAATHILHSRWVEALMDALWRETRHPYYLDSQYPRHVIWYDERFISGMWPNVFDLRWPWVSTVSIRPLPHAIIVGCKCFAPISRKLLNSSVSQVLPLKTCIALKPFSQLVPRL